MGRWKQKNHFFQKRHPFSDGAHQYITIPLSMMPGGLSKVTAIKESAVTNGRESPNEVIIKKENIE